MEKKILLYKTQDSKEPFIEWLFSLRDVVTRQRIEMRVERLRYGNYGDHKRFEGIIELRLNFGKGYRIYCGEDANSVVLLLVGGDKGSQRKDIKTAVAYWEDYRAQKKIKNV
ncbi:MAG: type II toxin-antitoxin system RelE/ParE family toxin [Candidatus Omnitrophica bacterium]|nr:type II toxin-antitoxin system RelE/ParE family toxin [Candidatus Omnitrophota bacterium]